MANLAKLLRSRSYSYRKRIINYNPFITLHILAYQSWMTINARCNNPTHKKYKYYGGRGITVCERWGTFINFLEDMGDPPVVFGRRLTLERKDNDKGYYKDNCKWASYTEQNNNRGNYVKHRILI